ncbi:uncharacterized protein TNCV_88051 [Trichonephila clavipes]|nr:uncharacterized protein TNCV_88051 [Trichonephila clavipes]
MSAEDIHHQITEVYGTEAISDIKVRNGLRSLKGGRRNVPDEERSDRPSVITDGLVQPVETKIRENSRFTINNLLLEFPDVSRSVVYKIETEDLNFKKLCSRWDIPWNYFVSNSPPDMGLGDESGPYAQTKDRTPIDADLREQILKLGPYQPEGNFHKDAKGRSFHHIITVSYPRQDKWSKGNGCANQHDFMLLTVRYVGFSLIEQVCILKKPCVKV